jgi:hypothetical protein
MTFLLENGRRPSRYSVDEEEIRLARLLDAYIYPDSSSYDPAFVDISSLLWVNPKQQKEKNKAAIIEFIEVHGFRPTRHSLVDEEKRLATALANYIWKGGKSYDEEFANQIELLCPRANKRKRARNENPGV